MTAPDFTDFIETRDQDKTDIPNSREAKVNQQKRSRKAVITGGSSGIGKSIVEKFNAAGFETATADIKDADSNPGLSFPADLTRPTQIDQFVDQVKHDMDCPDILVCNAGQGVHQKLTEGDPDTWEHIFKLNVFSAFRLIRAFVPQMVKNQSGDVVFISSVSVDNPYPYGGIYSATKAALDQLAETLRLEVQPDVRITMIHAGVVDTDFFSNMISGTQTPEEIGWGALQPKHIADAVFYAVSQPREVMLNDIVMRPSAQPM